MSSTKQGEPGMPPGVGIAVVAPGGYARDQEALDAGLARLRRQGCLVRNYYDPAGKYLRFGAGDDERLAQLHAAARDPDVDIVLALRGGYGMSRLLPRIDFDLLAASGKLFVGHSDFTALQMGLLARAGAPSFAGPMICDDFTRPQPSSCTMEAFWRCLAGPECRVAGSGAGNPVLEAEGCLWGGNLSMLVHLLGTPYLPSIEGGILFVEDINEHPYRVERMLLQLLHAGVLERQAALLLGDFSGYRLSEYDNGYDFATMLDYLRRTLPLPVLTGLPFGHVADKATLAVGSRARLSSQGQDFVLVMQGYPTLKQGKD